MESVRGIPWESNDSRNDRISKSPKQTSRRGFVKLGTQRASQGNAKGELLKTSDGSTRQSARQNLFVPGGTFRNQHLQDNFCEG